MSWRDRLIDASYKGISFKVLASDYGVGRRNSLHQFANREKPYLQDHGQDADDFIVDAYIIQSKENDYDYFPERDALIRVFKSKGSGILIHPFYGIKKVGLQGKVRISETFEEAGIARISATFVEAGERAIPKKLEDWISSVDDKVNELFDLVGDAFYTGYSTVGAFQDLVSNTLSRSIGSIQTALTATEGIATKAISESVGNINLIRESSTTITQAPIDIFNSIKDCCSGFVVICGLGEQVQNDQKSTSGFAGSNDLATGTRATDRYANFLTISTTVTGGETGGYSGVTRGNIIQLTGDNIPDSMGKSIIRGIINAIENFNTTGFGSTPKSQQINLALILDIYKFCMIANMCRVAIRIDFYGQDDMLEYLELIKDEIDIILLDMGAESAQGTSALGIGNGTDPVPNQDFALALESLRNVFVQNMMEKSSGITKAIDYIVPPDVETTLELVYEKYEDLDRMEEVYYRNRSTIKHPGFLPGGDTLRILDE